MGIKELINWINVISILLIIFYFYFYYLSLSLDFRKNCLKKLFFKYMHVAKCKLIFLF
jgi:hypothetical protein